MAEIAPNKEKIDTCRPYICSYSCLVLWALGVPKDFPTIVFLLCDIFCPSIVDIESPTWTFWSRKFRNESPKRHKLTFATQSLRKRKANVEQSPIRVDRNVACATLNSPKHWRSSGVSAFCANSDGCQRILPRNVILDGQNRAIVIAESPARVIAAIRVASVRWRSYVPQKHRN